MEIEEYICALRYNKIIKTHLILEYLFDVKVTSMSRPNVRLSLCLVEARDLVSKDVSGTSNPYCTFYITSAKSNPQVNQLIAWPLKSYQIF